jgi:hypothetical protein
MPLASTYSRSRVEGQGVAAPRVGDADGALQGAVLIGTTRLNSTFPVLRLTFRLDESASCTWVRIGSPNGRIRCLISACRGHQPFSGP